jgi:hypothetical protein
VEETGHRADDPTAKDPGEAVETATARVLELAQTWLSWDGRPRVSEGGDRIYTPHKVIRRHADHLIDDLAEVEAALAGVPTKPDEWHGSLVTMDSDWACFTETDLREAEQRLTRLARTFRLRLIAAGPDEWDRPRRESWTLREIAEHAGSSVIIPTSDWQPGDDSMTALLSGTLRADETGCSFVDNDFGKVTLVWPQGYTAARVGNGDIVVSAPSGQVVARTGDHVSLGGGQVPVDQKQPCLDGAKEAFVINQDLTSD